MPRVSSRVVIDIASNQVIERSSFLYDGPWELAKGDNSKAEMQRANTISDQQMQLMKQQLGMQQSQLNMVNPSLQAIISNGGMLPQQEAAMRTQAMQGLGGQYKNLQGQLSQQLAARGITGGQFAGGGDIARSFGSLGAMEAGQQSDLLNQIQLAKGQGLMGALQTGLGEAGMFGQQSLGFGSQGIGALGQGVTAANNADQASTAFFGSLMGAAGSLGSAAIKKCWVAAELYGGWLAPETISIRSWLERTCWMKPFLFFYGIFGEAWAAYIRRNEWARRLSRKLFDIFLDLSRA